MGTKGSRFSISKPTQRDSLVVVSLATNFHLNPKPRCIVFFRAFWTQYLSYYIYLHSVGKPIESTFVLVVVLLCWQCYDRLKVGRGLEVDSKTRMFFCTFWGASIDGRLAQLWVLGVDCKRSCLTSTYCKTRRCSTSCSIVSYIFPNGEPIKFYSCRSNEIASHIGEAQ